MGIDAIFGIVTAPWKRRHGPRPFQCTHRTFSGIGGRDKRPHCVSLQRGTIFPFVTAAGAVAEDGSFAIGGLYPKRIVASSAGGFLLTGINNGRLAARNR